MPINPDLLIMAPVLQDYLVNKDDGLPLSDGVITLFRDNSRTTLKNWYYQTGTAGAYTYTTLPNPMTLSGIGTTQDGNGNDILPMYYPYNEETGDPEPYYIVVQNSNLETQFTRQNFPFLPPSVSPTEIDSTNKNLIVNNVFWRNIGSITASSDNPLTNSIVINGVTYFYETIAPSQHDGFTMSDIQYFRNGNDSTDEISFVEFVDPSSDGFDDQILPKDVTPEFYMNIQCSSIGSETAKYIQIPLSLHVRSLSGYAFGTLKFQAMGVPGSTNAKISYSIFQFLGSGVTSPITLPEEVQLDFDWSGGPYEFNIPIPSAQNLLPSDGGVGDDALYIQFNFPVGLAFNINLAKPSFYLSENVPTNDFDTYDAVNAVISSPRTGDIRTSLNTFQPFGWLPMTDGTIGSNTSMATVRANNDTWQLYNLIYNSITNHWAPVVGGRSGDAYTDFAINNRPIFLTKALGRVMAGASAITPPLAFTKTDYGTGQHTTLTLTTGNPNLPLGAPVQVTGGSLPSALAINTVYYIIPLTGTTFQLAETLEGAQAVSPVPINVGSNGSGTVQSALGAYEGEDQHTLTVGELASHSHNASNSNPSAEFLITPGTGTVLGTEPNSGASERATATTGNSQPHNNIQPTTYMNIFIKL